MHGVKTIERTNADSRESRTAYGEARKAPPDLHFVAFPKAGAAVLMPASIEGLQWLQTQYPTHPRDGLAIALTDPDEIASAVASAEAAGLRVN